MNILTYNLALMLIGTSFIVGILHYFLEKYNYSLEYYIWNSFASLFFVNIINLKKPSSKII